MFSAISSPSMPLALFIARMLASFVTLFAPREALTEVNFLGIACSSPTVSWPRLTVPSLTDPKRWAFYLGWHLKIAGRFVQDSVYLGLDALLRAFVPPWVLEAAYIGYSTTIRNNKCQAVIDAIDGGVGAGTCKWYDGTRPATAGSATTLLGTLTFSDPSATKATGVLTFSAITPDSAADATSTVTWGRVADSAGTFCFDLNIATATADIVVNVAAIVTGAQLSISSWTITDGNP